MSPETSPDSLNKQFKEGKCTLPVATYPFRTARGQRLPKQLFYESWSLILPELRQVAPPFSLTRDIPGTKNLRKLYVALGDPTGYKLVQQIFNGEYEWWTFLMKHSWFREAVDTWNVELDAKLASEGLTKIREVAEGESAGSLAAARYLANKEYKTKAPAKGRATKEASKEEALGQAKVEAQEDKLLREDLERIRLVK